MTPDAFSQKNEWIEFNRRVLDNSITAEEILAGRLDVHKLPSSMEQFGDEELIDRLVIALETGLFYMVFFKTDGPSATDFVSGIHRIEMKYFDPKKKNPRINADFAMTFSYDFTFVLLKKSRITKYQLWEELLENYDDVKRKEQILESLRLQDPKRSEEKDVIPLITGTPEDTQMMLEINQMIEEHKDAYAKRISQYDNDDLDY